MATYVKASGDLQAQVKALMHRSYPDLADHKITVGVLMAHAPRREDGEPTGPAIKFAGWPAAAIVKINSLRNRVEGMPDATIILDGDTWEQRPSDEQAAILDHELYHIQVRKDEDEQAVLDDACRPKLKLRPHDFQIGGFVAICHRHGAAALEHKAMSEATTQLMMPWG